MNNFGFIKVASTIPTLEVANCKYNINEILKLAEQAEKEHVEIIAFQSFQSRVTHVKIYLDKQL